MGGGLLTFVVACVVVVVVVVIVVVVFFFLGFSRIFVCLQFFWACFSGVFSLLGHQRLFEAASRRGLETLLPTVYEERGC